MKFNNAGTGYNDNTSLNSWVYSTLLKVPHYLNYMKPFEKIVGLKFNRLTILERSSNPNKCLVRCDCGTIKDVKISHVKDGRTKSCGCYKIEQTSIRNSTHGLSKHPLHNVWNGIKSRCNNPNTEFYESYGGRGIKICNSWNNDFKAFYDWCIENGWEKGLEIDRKNNNGDYKPSNCRFVTSKENCRNRRDTRLITFKGETKSMAEWSEITGIKTGTIQQRLKLGWSVEDTLTETTKTTIAVAQYDLDGKFIKEWASFSELTKAGFNGSKICNCCKNGRRTSNGFMWKYA